MSRNFRYWLRMLARLADEPLKLSAARLAEKRAAAFSLTTRGWALLAGETSHGDTGERLEAEVIEAFNKLMLDRKLPRGRERDLYPNTRPKWIGSFVQNSMPAAHCAVLFGRSLLSIRAIRTAAVSNAADNERENFTSCDGATLKNAVFYHNT